MTKAVLSTTLALALFGAIFAVGGLASLQAGTPDPIEEQAKPYHYAWFLGVYSLFTIGVAIWAVHRDWHRLQAPVLVLLGVATVSIWPLISQNIYQTSQLPGGDGTALRGNITLAGLIILVIGNVLTVLATLHFNLSTASQDVNHFPGAGFASNNSSDNGAKGIHAGSGV